MKIAPLLALLFCLPPAARAQADLKCPEFKPKAATVRTMRMQPLKRGKAWLEGTPKSINSVSCDLYGMKTEEAEYDGKNLVLKHAFDPLMNLETVTAYSYDKGNNLAGTALNDFDGRQLRREAFASDKNTSSRTHSVFGETNELRKKTVYELREDGTLRREVRSTYDSGEQPVNRSEVYCDAKGRPEKELVYDADAAEPKYEYTYTYKYDPKGNWTEERRTRVIVFNGNRLADTQYAPEITKRDFLYY